MRTGKKQFLLIAGAIVLIAALYFAPRNVSIDSKNELEVQTFSFDNLVKVAKGQLKRQELERINAVEAELRKNSGDLDLIDSLGRMWDRLNMPNVSSHYYEQVAEKKQDEKSWLNAAYRYYDAFRMTGDSVARKNFVDKAILSYKKVLQLNPDNLDAKTDLGLCYAEGTTSPMEGIQLLREVVSKNPDHEMAQFNLGVLSVRSGQYERAVERFQKVLEINPNNKEARYLLGRTYSSMGKKDLALENLNLIKETDDTQLNAEVKILINKINNN